MSAHRDMRRFLWRWCYAKARADGMSRKEADKYAKRERDRMMREMDRDITLEAAE